MSQAAPVAISQNGTPVSNSADVWASIVANVAPLMALVGERHTKEYMRTMSTWQQLLNLAVAPVGILSILVSAVRLTGAPYLRRLIGRETEKRSESMVQLTPVSVSLATPIYVDGRIETEPAAVKDAAFVCCHCRTTLYVTSAIEAFRTLWLRRKDRRSDQDYEIILALRNIKGLSLLDCAKMVQTLSEVGGDLSSYGHRVEDATVSFRVTGVSPTQTAAQGLGSALHLLDLLVAVGLVCLMTGVQVAGFVINKSDQSSVQTLLMGLIGYSIVVLSTTGLLLLVRSEVVLEREPIPLLLRNDVWTVSNSTHTQWRRIKPLNADSLISAAPAKHSYDALRTREFQVAILSILLIGSYIVFYLGLRVAPWWVPLGSMLITWLAATYRALSITNTFQSTETNNKETWTAIPGDTVSASVKCILEGSESRPSGNALLIFVSPVRISPMSWSSAQDVLKVGIELTKQKSFTHTWSEASQHLGGKQWSWIVRFSLIVFIPGHVFRCEETVDLAVEHHFTFDHLTWTVLRLLHTCLDQRGKPESYDLEPSRQDGIFAALDGKGLEVSFQSPPLTLREFLKPFSGRSLDHVLLLPAIQVCSIYERFYYTKQKQKDTGMASLQNRHVDKLGLSCSAQQLRALQDELDERKLWDGFVTPISQVGPKPGPLLQVTPEDHYSSRNKLWGDLTGDIQGEERSESATAVAVDGSGS